MPQATTTRRKAPGAQKSQSKALVARLTDKGEEALQRIAELPGGTRALTAFNDLRNRVDDLGKKVRGIDALERRIAKLEKQVAELRVPRKSARGTSTRRTSTGRASTPQTPPTP